MILTKLGLITNSNFLYFAPSLYTWRLNLTTHTVISGRRKCCWSLKSFSTRESWLHPTDPITWQPSPGYSSVPQILSKTSFPFLGEIFRPCPVQYRSCKMNLRSYISWSTCLLTISFSRFEMFPEMVAKTNLKWAPRLCLTSTPAAPPIMPLGQPGLLKTQEKMLLFIQLTRYDPQTQTSLGWSSKFQIRITQY